MKSNHELPYLVAIAKRYFEDGLSQQQIAEEFGISRPTVSNLLKRCRSEGIVNIRITAPDLQDYVLHEALTARFGIRRAIVAETRYSSQSTLESVGEAAARYLEGVLTPHSRLGVSWGSTLFQVVRHMPHMDLQGMEVLQLVGGTCAENPNYDGFELARALSVRLHGSYRILPAPILVHDDDLHERLTREPAIARHLEYLDTVTTILAGVTSNHPDESALVRAGLISREESAALYEDNIIGHINGYHFTSSGIFPDIALNRRIVGIPLAHHRSTELVITACGAAKIPVIHALLLSGLVNVLVTDEHTTLGILNYQV